MAEVESHHDHHHADVETAIRRPGYYEMMETAIRELLIERKLIGPDEIRRQIEVLDSRTPALGAKIVARAWVDPAFRARLLADGRSACEELGITFYDDTLLIVLENTEEVHNLIVCTLCSCYPRPVLGLPPDWYKLKPYRARAVVDPRAVLAEFGTVLPDDVEVSRQRFDGGGALSCPADASKGNRKLQRRASRRARDPRHDDWGCASSPRQSADGAMSETESLVKRLPNDIGGLPVGPIDRVEHELEPWEKRCHALADVLDFHKLINTEEKRCGVEALGAEMVGKLTYYERWIVAFANILFRKEILTPTELAAKMKEVEARWTRDPQSP